MKVTARAEISRDELEVQRRAEGVPGESNESWQHKIPRSEIPSWCLYADSDVFEVSIKILGFSIIKTIWYRNCIQILNVHEHLLSIFVSFYRYPLGGAGICACLIQLICMDSNENASISLENNVHTRRDTFFTTKETNTHRAIGSHSNLF